MKHIVVVNLVNVNFSEWDAQARQEIVYREKLGHSITRKLRKINDSNYFEANDAIPKEEKKKERQK